MPEPLVPEPLLPEPEVCASTKGAVTTSTARAATTVLLNLLNISLCSYNLEGCALWVSLWSRVLLRDTQRGNRPLGKGAILMPQARAGQRALSGAIVRQRR